MFSWSQILYGAKEQAPRWKKCVALTDSLMGDLLGRYFVQEKFPPQSKDQAQKMVQYLENAFVENLQSLTWMDSDTKTLAKQKLNQISNKIGYPDKWTSYDSVFIEKNMFFENVQTLLTIGNSQQLSKINQNVDRNEWFMTPATVNAYYNPPAYVFFIF
jgi:putative endopeptidase